MAQGLRIWYSMIILEHPKPNPGIGMGIFMIRIAEACKLLPPGVEIFHNSVAGNPKKRHFDATSEVCVHSILRRHLVPAAVLNEVSFSTKHWKI